MQTVRFYPFVFTSTDEGGTAAYYNYSADGERNIKFTSPRLNIQQNASLFSNPPLVYPTLYASSLITLTHKGYSKHYFEGTRRVCTALGGGFSHVAWDSVAADTVPRVGWDAELLTKVLWRGVEYTYKCLGIGWKQTEDNSVSQMLYEQTHKQHDDPEPAFYYYTDHLGSTALLIDDSGRVVQKLAYMPYGEDWVDDSRISYSDTTRIGVYQFNGKERDYESGFLYYGARYYCPELWTGWTTPDPMMDRYPGISSYAYCNWNPVNLVDPDGRETDDYFTKEGKFLGSDNAETRNVRIIKECDWISLDKDVNGKVSHELAKQMSYLFSKASEIIMTERDQLAVYEHYNPTDCMLENLDNNSTETYGMRSHFEPNKAPTIQIRLKGNSTILKVCDYADEIINLFVHEKGHIDLYLKIGHAQYQNLRDSYKEQISFEAQIKDSSWNRTREKYKTGFYNYMKKFILNQ